MSDIKPETATKKPIQVMAMQFVDFDSGRGILEWVHNTDPDLPIRMVYNDKTIEYIEIETLEGTMRGGPGWWIIKGVKGEFYPCAPEIFDESYSVGNDSITYEEARKLHLTTEYESNTDWQDLARQIVFDWAYEGLGEYFNHPTFSKDEVYVVWYCFILGGWKALISTTLPDGRYYEVTYDKNKKQVYLDTYRKTHNQAIDIKET